MFFKRAAVIVAMTLLSVALLELRHRRLELVFEMTTSHRQLDKTRKSMWQTQTQIARLLEPKALEQAINQAQLQLEPVHDAPADTQADPNATSNSTTTTGPTGRRRESRRAGAAR